MSAAEHLAEAIAVGCSRDDHDHVGDHRREVMEEAARIALSLRQFERTTGARWSAQVSENVGILRVAEALAAEGKGTGTTGGEPTPNTDFFQAGQTYTDGNGYRAPELTTHFHVEHVTRHPASGQLRAIGWSKSLAPDARWHGDFCDEDEFVGWTVLDEPPLTGGGR